MVSPVTLRLNEKTRRRIERIARTKGLSTSEVIRQAIEAWADEHEAADLPYESLRDLIGVVHGGNPKRSIGTGRQFADLLKGRRSRS